MGKLKLIFLLLLLSCSFKSIVIPNATYLIADHVGDKYDLYYSQEKVFKKGLDQTIKDNRGELIKLVNHLKTIDIKNYNFEKDLANYSSIYISFATSINKVLAKPFSQFNSDQQKDLFQVLEDDNETILNRSRRDKTEEIAKRFTFFFDELSKEQYALIKSHISIFQDINKTRLQNRLAAQNSLKEAFKVSDVQKREVIILNIFEQNLKQREPMSNLKKVAGFCTKFFKTLSSKQVKFFKQKQKTIIEWIQALIDHYK